MLRRNMEVLRVVAFILLFACEGSCVSCPHNWTRYGRSCFLFSREYEPWPSATIICNKLGGRLAEIHDWATYNFLAERVIQKRAFCWLGGNDLEGEGTWMWTNSKQRVTYVRWHPSEPSNGGSQEHCLELQTNRYVNDVPCKDHRKYICEIRR